MTSTIGTAYIDIAPNMTGIQGKIASGLSGSGSQFADQFSSEVSGKSAAIIGAISGAAQVGITKAMNLITNTIGSAVSRVDTLNSATRTFQYMGFAADDSSKAVKAVTASIQGLPTPLDGAIRGMTALAATYGDVGLGQKMFTALNDGILGFGGSAAMVDGAIQQISQLPMDGPLDAQTWNSLRNSGLTPVLVAMGKDMGKSIGDLKTQFGDGTLKVQDFVNELTKMDTQGGGGLTNLHAIAMNATSGIGTGFANMQTAVTRGIANIIQAIGQKNISNAIAEIGKAFEKVLDIVAKNIPIIVADIKSFFDYVVRNKDVFGPLAVAISAVVGAIVAWKTALFIWSEVTKIATGIQAAFNAVMDANPITLIALAIIGLVAGLVYFFTQTAAGKEIWSDFTAFLIRAWDDVKTGFSAVGSFFTSAWSAIKSGLDSVGSFFKSIFDAISGAVGAFLTFFSEHWRLIIAIILGPFGLAIDFITAYWSQIVNVISSALSAIWNVIYTVFSAITGVISSAWSFMANIVMTEVNFIWGIITGVFGAVSGFMSAVFGPPIGAIINAFQWLAGTVGGIIGGIWDGITKTFDSVMGFLEGVGGKIVGMFAGAGDWLYDVGKDLINGLINGAGSLLSKIGDMFLNIIPGWIKEPFKKALGIHSPSTVFSGYADNTIDGYTNTIIGRQGDVTSAIGGMADAAVGAMATTAPGIDASSLSAPKSAARASAASQIGTTTTITNTFTGNIYNNSGDAVKEMFRQLNQDTLNVSMGLTPNQGAI